MIVSTYIGSSLCLFMVAIMFQNNSIDLTWFIILLTLTFVIASPGASSAHLVVS